MIELISGLVMVADEYCYTVGKPRETACRGIVLDKPKYYSSVTQAVQGALDFSMRQAVKDGRITTLREFIQEQDRQREELAKLIAPLDSGGNPCTGPWDGRQASETGIYTPGAAEGAKPTYRPENFGSPGGVE